MAIKILGFDTTQSCEGHKTRVGAWNCPFVDFYIDEQKIEGLPAATVESMMKEKKQKMEQLLREFNEQNPGEPDEELIIVQYNPAAACRIQCRGGSSINTVSEQTATQIAQKYRLRMANFAQFLKSRYLNN